MAKDLIYYFDKKTSTKTELGEIQSQFNMSFVIDGTKDSCQANVWSYVGNEIEPYTIIYHEKTDSWWIVSNDKVERYQNDSGFMYMHQLELLGAIELLNARDLTDIGFYQNEYTVQQFIARLFTLSNFEFNNRSIRANGVITLSQKVDYIKTYENYTLLSALRDFLGGYNITPKLLFSVNSETNKISNAILSLYSKTGQVNATPIDISSFDNVRETKTIDKNSYGTIVVSNVDNATATKMQVFPIYGGVPLMGDTFKLSDSLNNSYVKLPSNLNNIEWVKMYMQCNIRLTQLSNGNEDTIITETFFNFDNTNIDYILEKITNYIHDNWSAIDESWESKKEEIANYMKEMGVSTLNRGIGINALTGEFVNNNNILIPEIHTTTKQVDLVLVEEDTKKALGYYNAGTHNGIGYQKGSNKITVDFFAYLGGGDIKYFTTASKSFDCGYYSKAIFIDNIDTTSIYVHINPSITTPANFRFAVKYEPMTDIKIKVDNDRDTNDIQIYNQNGKLTDSRAFSKLLDSYSKEISSDTITRYMNYYDFNDVPEVGTLVTNGSDMYVINNISLDFYENESSVSNSFGYFINAEITMSKYVSTKSLMTNPNSNIRDYGIPQKNTVKRKQLYRDYVEFNFTAPTRTLTYYRPLNKVLNFYSNVDEFVRSLIRVTFATGTDYYYQLDTTRYNLKKTFVTMVDFQDNNIIGNDMQNRYSGFQLSRVLTAWTMSSLTNTPIQYTDDNGKVKGISLILLDDEEYNKIIDGYIELQSGDMNYKYNLTSRCFINNGIYSRNTGLGYGITITESSYYKDPLEIPVFEYMAQINSTKDVLICENIFPTDINDDIIVIYTFELVDKNSANEFNCDSHYVNSFSSTLANSFALTNAMKFEYSGTGTAISFYLKFYIGYSYTEDDGGVYEDDFTPIPRDYDIVIFRNYIKRTVDNGNATFTLDRHEPVMVIKTKTNTSITGNTIRLYPDTYKLN